MNRAFCIFIFLVTFATQSFAFSYDSPSYSSMQSLSGVERELFGRPRVNIHPYQRLSNAERAMFGTTQPGDFESRVQFLNSSLEDYKNNRRDYYNKVRKVNTVKSLMNNIFGGLNNGYMTGYTPPVYSAPAYSNYYQRTTYPYNVKVPQTRSVYGNFVTQTGVRILED